LITTNFFIEEDCKDYSASSGGLIVVITEVFFNLENAKDVGK
jgi:hypothetical protein